MRFTFTPEALRRRRAYEGAEYEYLVRRARECILWNMSPEYWDNMNQIEYMSWIEAWNDMQKEQEERAKQA